MSRQTSLASLMALISMAGACGAQERRFDTPTTSEVVLPSASSFGTVSGKSPRSLRIWMASNPKDLAKAFQAQRDSRCEIDPEGRILTGSQAVCSVTSSEDAGARGLFANGTRVYFALRVYEDAGTSVVLAESNAHEADTSSGEDCGYVTMTLEQDARVGMPVCAVTATEVTNSH